jgi:hypothetical protein
VPAGGLANWKEIFQLRKLSNVALFGKSRVYEIIGPFGETTPKPMPARAKMPESDLGKAELNQRSNSRPDNAC